METTTEYKTEKAIEVTMPSLRELERAKVAQLEYDLTEIKNELLAEGFVTNANDSLTWASERLKINCTVTFNGITADVELSYYDECLGELVEEQEEVETALVADYCIDKLRDLLI